MGCPKEGKARKEYIERLSKLVSRKINGQPEGCKDFPNIGKMYYQNREHLEYIDEFSELFNEAIQDGRFEPSKHGLPAFGSSPLKKGDDILLNILLITVQSNKSVYFGKESVT